MSSGIDIGKLCSDDSWAPLSQWYTSQGQDAECRMMMDQVVWQHHKNPLLVYIKHLFLDEVQEGVGRRMVSLCNSCILPLQGPGSCCQEH